MWFQYKKRTSWILRCTYQNMPGKQAFYNYHEGCQNLTVTQAFVNDLLRFQNSQLGKNSFLING